MFKHLTRVAAALFVAASTASAHEFWIQPAAFDLEAGSLLRVQLFHGERFDGDIVPIDAGHIQRFELGTADASSPVRTMDGMAHGFLRPAAPGTIVYTTSHYSNTLPAERFEAYLREEGLDRICQLRAAAGETDQPGSEAYARCAKALITVNNGPRPTDTPQGLDLELVLLSTPTQPEGDRAEATPAAGTRHVRAQLLFKGKPLADTRVVGVSRSDPTRLTQAFTDHDGIVTIPAPEDGPFMLTALHMTRYQPDAATPAVPTQGKPANPTPPGPEWESFWASLTFDLD